MSHCPVHELFLLIPSISRWQWHPISVAGVARDVQGKPRLPGRACRALPPCLAAHQPLILVCSSSLAGAGSVLTLHIKQYGKWSKVKSDPHGPKQKHMSLLQGKPHKGHGQHLIAILVLPPDRPRRSCCPS